MDSWAVWGAGFGAGYGRCIAHHMPRVRTNMGKPPFFLRFCTQWFGILFKQLRAPTARGRIKQAR
jgi:hypothetical protein